MVQLELLKESKDLGKKPKSSEPSIPPPRIASGARGNAAKALLENFGFELVIQYNENRQKVQKKGKSGEGESTEKLECGTCGKLFSNVLILTSHQEHAPGVGWVVGGQGGVPALERCPKPHPLSGLFLPAAACPPLFLWEALAL